ncbi:hypothetical protein WN55_11226 [Dufourea novaeangliae]|uniref:Protein phosphatase 1 regulatory subunit 35 C-terminal domain-containing protein n=1 Tax=Dufourea novaeangliae TaxID=178035 RepID=A0A154P9W5_DUFNO|nr:hypothetical protein WN55_11226 [Dufourea novaeangliae]
MSENTKFFFRPKVRFCQTDADELNKEELKNSTDQKNANHLSKPKIRSIVTLDKPIILLKSDIVSNNLQSKISKSSDCTKKIESPPGCNNATDSCTEEIASPLINTSCKAGTQKPLSNLNNSQCAKLNSKEADKNKQSDKSSIDTTAISLAPIVQEETLDEVLKSQNSVKSAIVKRDYMKHSKIIVCKVKPCLSSTDSKKMNESRASTISFASRKAKTKSVDVMPCHKYGTVTSRTKTSHVKKIMIRDVAGPKVKPYIGPGVPRKRQDVKGLDTDKNASTKLHTSGEKLARPEYNSIMCTINKLNEMKQEKVVVDFEHLGASYKNFINRKISSALDFPLDEAVYKNLMDLSIDEKQLPSRLTRSKDPEPRQRDIVPILSDFFKPESTEEYCTAVSIKPRAAEVVDSWNPFKISDKIFEWKHRLDHV